MTAFEVRRIDAEEARRLIDELSDILVGCVEGGASVSFMSPFTLDDGRAFWSGVIDKVAQGETALFIAQDGTGVHGTVQLGYDLPPNQPHRCDLKKLLVHPRARRRGMASALLEAAEKEAARVGRPLIVLDTATGEAAEPLYRKQGYREVGVIPRFALMPQGGYCSTTFFYKEATP